MTGSKPSSSVGGLGVVRGGCNAPREKEGKGWEGCGDDAEGQLD
jgi:hypothetical protein